MTPEQQKKFYATNKAEALEKEKKKTTRYLVLVAMLPVKVWKKVK